jgi:hypothetical protein
MVDVKAQSDLGLSVAKEYLRCGFSATSAKSYSWHCQMARTYRIWQSSTIAKLDERALHLAASNLTLIILSSYVTMQNRLEKVREPVCLTISDLLCAGTDVHATDCLQKNYTFLHNCKVTFRRTICTRICAKG